jgi:PAS domain-containing protein
MALTSRDYVTQADLPLALIGPASRRRTLRVLFVHGDAAVVEHCVRELRSAHFKVSADVVLTPEQFLGRLKTKCYDVVLAEHPSANWQDSQALEILRLRERQVPCIFLTHTTQLETLAKLITQGAADCVGMDHIGHLPVAVRRALSENNLREERDQTEKKLRHSEARYRALVGNLNYGICRCNSKGKFLDVNQALVTMLGYEPCERDAVQRIYASAIAGAVRWKG